MPIKGLKLNTKEGCYRWLKGYLDGTKESTIEIEGVVHDLATYICKECDFSSDDLADLIYQLKNRYISVSAWLRSKQSDSAIRAMALDKNLTLY